MHKGGKKGKKVKKAAPKKDANPKGKHTKERERVMEQLRALGYI